MQGVRRGMEAILLHWCHDPDHWLLRKGGQKGMSVTDVKWLAVVRAISVSISDVTRSETLNYSAVLVSPIMCYMIKISV